MTAAAMERFRGLKGFHSCGENQYQACCPGHDDRKASLSISIGNDSKILLHCHAGCSREQILEPLGLKDRDLFADNGNGHKEQRIVEAYPYQNINGQLSYEVVRLNNPKDFRQRKPDGNGGWIWKASDLKRLPYNLPELTPAGDVFIVEGEKDVESLRKIGLTATCNSGGAGNWTEELNQYFRPEHRITIIPDNDPPGEKHGQKVAENLHGKVASLKILRLEGLPEKGDVSDWLQGRDPEAAAEELCRLADAVPEWKPEEKPSIIHWAAEALQPQPEKEYIVQDLIGVGDIATIIGDAGSKKTWISLDVAVCVGLGKDWLGRHVSRSNVLIIDEESGERRLKMRLGDCMRAHEAGTDLPLAFTSLAGVTLTTDSGKAILNNAIAETQPRLIVMDALQDLTLGLDENSGKELAPAIYTLRQIAETHGCAIWLIHHVNKQGGYRGHSSIKGLVDVMLKCESATDSSHIQFTAEKTRDSLIKPFAATAHFDIGRFWLSDAEPQQRAASLGRPARYVRDFLLQQPSNTASVSQITANPDTCTPASARKAIYDLAAEKMLRRVDDGGQGSEAAYQWIGSEA